MLNEKAGLLIIEPVELLSSTSCAGSLPPLATTPMPPEPYLPLLCRLTVVLVRLFNVADHLELAEMCGARKSVSTAPFVRFPALYFPLTPDVYEIMDH